jgi:hypothetical protein
MSDTPKTDALQDDLLRSDTYTCWQQMAQLARELERENAALKIERNRLRVVLQDIADASGFDNIGNWARNKAKDALAKEAKP